MVLLSVMRMMQLILQGGKCTAWTMIVDRRAVMRGIDNLWVALIGIFIVKEVMIGRRRTAGGLLVW